MSVDIPQTAQRDSNLSIFGELLEPLRATFKDIDIIVFHDINGETIDYQSMIDPYATRVLAAHHGIIYESARARVKWLELGAINRVTIYGVDRDCVTAKVGEDNLLTIIAKPGIVDTPQFSNILEKVLADLEKEADL